MSTETRPDAGDNARPPGLSLRSARGRWVLAASVLGSGLAQLDGTVVNVALPRIGTNLHAGLTSLQWLLNGYTLTLSGLLLLGGSLGDRLGRRRVFAAGVLLFAVASACCAAAPDPGVLIALRAVQGVGAALLTPGSLALLEASFRPDDRAAAVGAWSGLGGVATAVGPVVGGVLVGVAPWGWRLVFLINLPLAALVLAVTARWVPESSDDSAHGRLDVPGAGLAAAGLASMIFALTEGPAAGWTPTTDITLAGGLLLLAAFVTAESRTRDPLLPLSLFRSRQFTATNAVTFVIYASLSGALFLLPVQLQIVSGFSPVKAGSSLLPVTAVMLLLSAKMGRLAQRIGPRWPMTVGPVLAGGGLALLARVGPSASYLTAVLPAVVVFGFGLAATVAPLTATALSAAPARLVGVASAVNNDVARVAGLVAVAVMPPLAGITARAYHQPAALSAGFHRAVLIAAVLCAAGGALSAISIRRNTDAQESEAARQGPASRTHTVIPTPPVSRRTPGMPPTGAADVNQSSEEPLDA